jgi:hypothetical protein
MGQSFMTIIAPSRFRGVAATLAAVALAIAVFGLVAQRTARGLAGAMADGDSTMEGGEEIVVGGRIAGALAELRRGKARADAEIGVILGPSAVGMDFDPTQLEAAADPALPSRWLSLYANGANASDIHGLAELLIGSGLKVKLLVLCLHPTLIARSDHYLSDRTEPDARPFWIEVEAGHLSSAKDQLSALMLVPLNRVFRERTRIGHEARVLISFAKRRMFAAIGLGADSLFAAVRDPWTVQLLIPDEDNAREVAKGGRRVAARELRDGPMRELPLGDVKDKGWYNRGSYSSTGANARDLVATIRDARSHRIEVVLLFLPERSDFRSRVPSDAMTCLREALELGFGAEIPLAIDLRDAVPDDQFHDLVHLKAEARSLTTRRLIERLRARRGDSAK